MKIEKDPKTVQVQIFSEEGDLLETAKFPYGDYIADYGTPVILSNDRKVRGWQFLIIRELPTK